MCYIQKNGDLKDLGNFDARLFLRFPTVFAKWPSKLHHWWVDILQRLLKNPMQGAYFDPVVCGEKFLKWTRATQSFRWCH